MPSNDYRSWSFADRPFVFAVAVSLLWHLFWFLTITIVVVPPRKAPRTQPLIVSLGPVLNDAIFKTLVESRPEISKAFYRQPADIASATEAPVETVPRYDPGDVISVPQGRRFIGSMKELVSGTKAAPEAGLPTLISEEEGGYFEFIGTAGPLRVLSRPPEPADLPAAAALPTEIEFSLDERGRVTASEIIVSSGDPSTDLAWEDHLRQWIFAEDAALGAPRLRVRFHRPSPEPS